jgi:hypothetical protein
MPKTQSHTDMWHSNIVIRFTVPRESKIRIEVFKAQLRTYEDVEARSFGKTRNNPSNELFADSCPSISLCNDDSSKRSVRRSCQRRVTSRIANQGPVVGCKQVIGYLINEIQVRIRRRLLHDQYILSQGKHCVEFVTTEFIKTTPMELHCRNSCSKYWPHSLTRSGCLCRNR